MRRLTHVLALLCSNCCDNALISYLVKSAKVSSYFNEHSFSVHAKDPGLLCGENLAFHGDFIAVLAKRCKHFSLEDSLAIGVDRMQCNFGPLKNQVEEWGAMRLATAAAKLLIYQAFIAEETGFPKHLARRMHDLYFQPVYQEFQHGPFGAYRMPSRARFKELEPIHQYKATAKLAGFLQAVRPS